MIVSFALGVLFMLGISRFQAGDPWQGATCFAVAALGLLAQAVSENENRTKKVVPHG